MKMVTLREASQKTGYNKTYLWQLVKAKRVKAGKGGNIWLADLDELKQRKKEIENERHTIRLFRKR